MKRKEKKRISANLNRDIVLEFAVYLIINMYEAKCAAEALMEKELYGQARSMTILALEEFGKLGPTLSFLADPIRRPNYIEDCFDHKSKQMRGHLLTSIAPMLLKLGISTSTDGYQDIGEFVRDFETKLTNSQLEAEVVQIAPELQKIIEKAESGVLENERQNGLYVSYSIDDNSIVSVKHPNLVSRADAQKFLDLLAIYSDQSMGDIFECLSKKYGSFVDDKSTWAEAFPALKAMVEDLVQHLYPHPPLLPGEPTAD